VTHETKHFIYFYLGQVAVLLFKSGWDMDLKKTKHVLRRYIILVLCTLLLV
jgi:NhaP-type Na+/H+ or K+/H+ antiporter